MLRFFLPVKRRAKIALGSGCVLLISANLTTVGWSATVAGDCNPVKVKTCALPFPSDLFTEENNLSPTGKHIVIPDRVFELFANETPQNPVPIDSALRPSAIYETSSGYSAAIPVLFELDRPVDENTLATDGGRQLQVYEIGGDGQPVPIEVGLMEPARTKGVARMDTVIEAWPRSRWKFGSQYVAVLTRAITPAQGDAFERSPGIESLLNEPDSTLGRAHATALATLLPALENQGLSKDDILSLTFFTVRDEAEVITPLARMVQKVYNEPHEFRGWNVEHHANHYRAVTVTGEVRLSNYRDSKGGFIFDTSYPGDEKWVAFVLTLPQSAAQAPAPLVIYGHGIGANKETLEAVDQFNAERGIATLAIDQPNHGTRSQADGGFIWDILAPEGLNKVVGMVSQSSLDMVGTLAAIEQQLATLNTLPRNTSANLFPWQALTASDKKPDLDLTRIFYEGTSMGGVLGSAFLGLTPKLDGAFLQVGGTGITNILTHSTLWSRFKHMAPAATTGAELAVYLGMVQQAIDLGDGINFIHNVRQGSHLLPYTYQPFPLGLMYGQGDGIVFNKSSVSLSEIAQLPLATPDSDKLLDAYTASPLTKLPNNQWFDNDGYGVRMVAPLKIPIREHGLLGRILGDLLDTGNSMAAHGSFLTAGSREFQAAWTDLVILQKPAAEITEDKSNE